MSKKRNRDSKRSLVRLVALVLCVLLAGTTIAWALMSVAGAEENASGTELSLVIEEGAQAMRALQYTRYLNETGERLGHVIFALPVNALRRPTTSPFEDEGVYINGFTAGGASITRVGVNGEEANWGARGEGEEFIRVSCDIAPGESALFEFEYQVLLPEMEGFAGAGEIGSRATGCFLTPCAFENGEFVCVNIRALGECCYCPAQDYTVKIDAPDTYLIASGGEQSREQSDEGRAITTVRQKSARGFSMALGRRYTAYFDEAEGVEIVCYANTGYGARRALNYARRIIKTYISILGDCPVSRLAIAQADLDRDIESASGLLLADKALFSSGQNDSLEAALALGIARQWFGLAVCNNPEYEPWLSEALCAYMSLLYCEDEYGKERFQKEINARAGAALNITIPGSLTPDSFRAQFTTRSAYEAVVRWRGAAVLHQLRSLIGDEGMRSALKEYYQRSNGKFATSEQFINALNLAAGRDISQALAGHMASIHEYVGEEIE